MATPYTGNLSNTQIQAILDPLGTVLENCYGSLGLGLSGETTTAAYFAELVKTSIVGDGATSYGIGNNLAQTLTGACDALLARVRWDAMFSNLGRAFVSGIDSQIQSNVPTGWNLSSALYPHYLNNSLLRMNAAHTGVPTTPGSAGTLTAGNNASGAIALCSSGNAPYCCHTLIGTNEWDESLPSPTATQVALTGSNNAYTYQIAGTVPTGVTAVKIYRSPVAGSSSNLGYDQKVAVTAGAAYPAITILQSDSRLAMSWQPPGWLSCLLKPSSACIVALAYAVSGGGTGFLSQTPGAPLAGQILTLNSVNMLTPANVALTYSNAFLGLGNNAVPQTAILGTTVVGTGFTAGVIQTTNNASSSIQGFGGATKVQARVIGTLNAAGTTAITYQYYDAAHGYGSVQSATASAVSFSGTAVGSTAVYSIPAGRLVIAVTADTVSGITSGTYLIEAQSVR